MYILILLLTLTFSIQGTISWLESYACTKSQPIVARIAGETHDTDPANQRKVLIDSLKNYAHKTNKPLTVSIEDPLAIPGLEKLSPPRGLLLGLATQLQELELPKQICIQNFDTKKAANCAIHFFCQAAPKLTTSVLDELRFGDLITELQHAQHLYANHATLENLGATAKKDCARQLAAITTQLDLLQKNLINLRISAGDSMAQTAIDLHHKSMSVAPLYKPLYEADVGLTSLAAIVTTFESKESMALLCGEHHAKDVSRIIEYEQWTDLGGPLSFSSDWLLYAIGN